MEIELGHYSDMPGVVYYKYKLDKKGRVLRDEDGLALLKCHRGTNDVEATHRVINKMLGTSSCGEEFAERPNGWAAGRRHRCNHDTAHSTPDLLCMARQMQRPASTETRAAAP
jgi:hypothetical protein